MGIPREKAVEVALPSFAVVLAKDRTNRKGARTRGADGVDASTAEARTTTEHAEGEANVLVGAGTSDRRMGEFRGES